MELEWEQRRGDGTLTFFVYSSDLGNNVIVFYT